MDEGEKGSENIGKVDTRKDKEEERRGWRPEKRNEEKEEGGDVTMAANFTISSDSESEPSEEVEEGEDNQSSPEMAEQQVPQRHSLTLPDIRKGVTGRMRVNSESHSEPQGRAEEEAGTPTDGAPFRGRSKSAPPALWAAKKYGRQLRRMSDEFDSLLDKGAAIQMSPCMTSHFCLLLLSVMSLMLLFSPIGWSYDGLTPGCHLHPFNVTIRSDRRGTCKGTHLVYACVGYCESSAFPSRYSVLVASNFTHNITSASRCCTISKDAKVKVRLDCPRGRHHDEIEILTAKACRCDMCRKSRY
ncbi:Glycoprotein hormone alpha-2 [Nibea albiflora]|uniref:Glycoprotein hormone alpha-2 n=1 Tax=Nibea albiflora TaxID=240163 RepID=A0ACB7EVH0_NIBAL|nr:Glycoprotein hormone alpha-2 [Nibea albiflora]